MTHYLASFNAIDDDKELQRDWQSLCADSRCEFFLSWHWIGAWVSTFKPNAQVLRVHCHQELVAMAILVPHTERRHKVICSSTVRINHTGEPSKDQIWSEFNGLLLKRNHEKQASQCFFYALNRLNHWDEIVLGVIDETSLHLYQQTSDCAPYRRWQAKGYSINLNTIRQSGDGYLASLSRNTRYHINKTKKWYEAQSKINLTFAQDAKQAQRYLEAIAPLHIQRWSNSLYGSGFTNPSFVDFHQQLIDNNWHTDSIDIIKVACESNLLGYFYNFKYNNKVYFYLSAIDYPSNGKYKPGLLAHALCVQHYLDKGFDYYDFLGGDAQYKKSLSNEEYTLYELSLKRPRLKFMLEDTARGIKHTLLLKRKAHD